MSRPSMTGIRTLAPEVFGERPKATGMEPCPRLCPKRLEGDKGYCTSSGATLHYGFCGSLTCGRRAWQIVEGGTIEHGRLCERCLKSASAGLVR